MLCSLPEEGMFLTYTQQPAQLLSCISQPSAFWKVYGMTVTAPIRGEGWDLSLRYRVFAKGPIHLPRP
jgi:hypothetical protein